MSRRKKPPVPPAMRKKPGPKKGAIVRRVDRQEDDPDFERGSRELNKLGATIVARTPAGTAKTYRLPDGELISKREYQKRERIQRFADRGIVFSNEQYAKFYRAIESQVRLSQRDDLTRKEKLQIATAAALVGMTKPARAEQQLMWEDIRSLDLESDDFVFQWGEDNSAG